MEHSDVASIVSFCIILGLLALLAVSFTLFIRRLLINSSVKSNQTNEIAKKLDKIIELLEQGKKY
jgi:hypothetical protein